jgi:hypothetical protein
VSLFKIRSLPPPRSGDDVVDAVSIQIAEIGAFTPELVMELNAFESVQLRGGQ